MQKSDSIKELASALAKANSEISRIAKDAANPFFKNTYATLDQIVDEIRPILTKNGLSIMQMPSGDGDNVHVTTLLLHESGEWLESDPLIMRPVKNDPQGMGSAITYARRYSLSAFLSLNTGQDDDGNQASHVAHQNQQRAEVQRPMQAEGMASEKQRRAIFNIGKSKGLSDVDIQKLVLDLTGKERTTDLTSAEASKVIDHLSKMTKSA